MAFEEDEESTSFELVENGKAIVKKCCNVPLAIRVVGSLLYGQAKSKWIHYKTNGLGKITQGEGDIMPVLKLSYHHLTPSLKTCFSYCAVFPKDYVIRKKILIDLWLAQGCIVPLHEGQSIEDAGEEYFSILLQRCFFQDVQKDKYGEIISCKMHDLMQDLAQEVAGKEYATLTSIRSHPNRQIRHLSVVKWQDLQVLTQTDCLAKLEKSRTLLFDYWAQVSESRLAALILRCRCLRALALGFYSINSLPSTISELRHLRYLDLSENFKIKKLPESITKLHNLQVLNLRYCFNLKELPENLSKLVNLRVLDLEGCDDLTHMPTGMNNLTCLQELNLFVVDGERTGSGKIKDLKALVNLRGELTIRVRKSSPLDIVSKATQAGNDDELSEARARLKRIMILGNDLISHRKEACHEALLDELQPDPDYLRELEIMVYRGVRLPSWACRRSCMTTLLPSLVRMELTYLPRLRHLPALSRLHHLKHLHLNGLPRVKYMEERDSDVDNDNDNDGDAPLTTRTFFPSLEELHLIYMPKLKGWWREGEGCGSKEQGLLSFSALRHLEIIGCPKMKSYLARQILKELELIGVNERLRFGEKGGVQRLCVDDLRLLTLLRESVAGLVHLTIKCSKQKSFSKGFRHCTSSLRRLEIDECDELESLRGGGLEHLTSLETLSIKNCCNLAMDEDEDEDEDDEEKGLPWKSLQTLSSLSLHSLPKMSKLPNGFQYLTALQSLQINDCVNLTALAEWLCCLTSLRSLSYL